MDRFKVIDRFAGAQVHIQRSGGVVKIDLGNATAQQLKRLYELGHPAIEKQEEAKPNPPTKANPVKDK